MVLYGKPPALESRKFSKLGDVDVALLDEFKASGVTIIEPDVESFRQATLAVVPAKFEAKWGKGTFDSIANMK